MNALVDALVVVGRRSAAVEVARRVYPVVVQVGQGLAAPDVNSGLTVSPGSLDKAVESGLTVLPGSLKNAADASGLAEQIKAVVNPVAVVALTEAAVVGAALLRDELELPGLSVSAAQACSDKIRMKQVIGKAGIACARFVRAREGLDRTTIVARLGLPLVLKTQRGSGGRGARVIHDAAELPRRLPTNWMAESFVAGTEMSVESFVIDGAVQFVNFTQYYEPRWANILPAQIDTPRVDELQDLNQRAITALQIDRGITHMEVFLSESGPVFGEIAARPPGGYLMELMRLAYDFDPWQTLFAIEAGMSPALPHEAVQCAGVRVVHPGAGRVRAVRGRDAIAAMPALAKLHNPLRAGKVVSERIGAGQTCGYALFAGSREQVEAGLEAVRTRLLIELE